MTSMSRRGLLGGGAGLAAAHLLGATAAHAQATRLRLYYWGSKDRADRTTKAIDLYGKKTPAIALESEFVGWSDYWARMATQAAARNLPDLIQMDFRYIFEYARRGALMPLDQFVGKELDIADFGATSIDCGRVDGKLYGIDLGNNSVGLLTNVTLFEKYGIAAPKAGTTWKEFAEIGAAVAKASGGSVFGSSDMGGGESQFECWLRQRGKPLYTEAGKPGFVVDDIAEWFDIWNEMRKVGACVPPDLQAQDKDTIDTSSLVLGKAACAFSNSNQLVGFQALTKNKIGLTMYPSGGPGAKPGQYMKPSMYFSIAGNSKLGAEAARFINFFVKDPGAIAVLGAERGVPPSAAARAALAPTLDELGRVAVDYISFIADKVGPLPPAPPKGAGEVYTTLKRFNEQVGFGKLKPKEAGKAFFDEAVNILDRG
jgi:multiple sugar transport system substrate-binding protein